MVEIAKEDEKWAMISSTIKSNLSFKVSKRRVQQRLSQKDMAEKLGMSLKSYQLLEVGGYNFTIEELAKICSTLDIDLSVNISINNKRESE